MFRKYIGGIKLIFIGLLLVSVICLYKGNKSLREDLSVSISNEKAYSQENSLLKDKNRVFKFTVEQLEYLNDSLIHKMDSVRKELNIKDKNIKQLQYLLSNTKRTDTILFKDTLFRDPTLNIDTTIVDDWYKLSIDLIYPNIIVATPEFTNEYYILTSYRKETIRPPKKCKVLRWFQRKHKILEVQVINNNPYSINKKQKFVEIVD